MDKALEKVIKLEEELKKLNVENDNIADKIEFTNNKRIKICNLNAKLIQEKEELESKKSKIKYKSKNIKKGKKFTILNTIFYAAFFALVITLLNLKLNVSVLMTVICSAFAIPLAVFLGESGNYYFNRKYLKKHKLEDVEKEINEKEKKISFNNKKINTLQSQLTELNIEKVEIEDRIDLTEEEIQELLNLRSAVIRQFIKDNQEFDNLVEKEVQKQKIKR